MSHHARTTTVAPVREKTYTIGEVGQLIHEDPSRITNALYRRRLDTARCPTVAGRRRIPESYLPQVRAYFSSLRGE